MPYIPKVDRPPLNRLIAACPKGWDTCYYLVKKVLLPKSYRVFAECIAVFECALLEYERRTGLWISNSWLPPTELPDRDYSAVDRLAQFIDIYYPSPHGVLNYCCTLLHESPEDFRAAKEFMYTNDVGPYEDQAIKRNGDLPLYEAYSATDRQ